MLKFFAVIVTIILLSSCRNGSEAIEKKDTNTSNDYGGFDSFPIESRFTLPYPDNLQLDSNSLLFYRTSSFDTCLLIHFYKKNNSIKVVCYETLPAYHRFINDYADAKSHLLFFEGYSFTIDSARWISVKMKAEKMLADSNTKFTNDRCADCGFGLISHNFKTRRTNNANRILYDDYALWIKDSILKQIIEQRRQVGNRNNAK